MGTTRKGGLIYPRERRAFTFQFVLNDPTARPAKGAPGTAWVPKGERPDPPPR
jgi:hypothetical protein